MQSSVAILPVLDRQQHKLDLIGRGFQREMCRGLVIVYEWFTFTAPWLCEHLMHLHRTVGFQGMTASVQYFADLVDHIVQYMYPNHQG